MSEGRITIKDRVLQLLELHHEGLSAQQLTTTLNVSIQALYSAVHDYNKKKTGQRIVNVNSKYKVVGKRQTANIPATVDAHDIVKHTLPSGISLPPGFSKKLKNLSPDDVTNFCDMVKKSLFYQKSATALVEANEAAAILRESLTLQGGL